MRLELGEMMKVQIASKPSLGEVVAVWAVFGVEAEAIYWTYRRGKAAPWGAGTAADQVRIFLRHPTVAAIAPTLPIVLAHQSGTRGGFAPRRDGDGARLALGLGLVVWSLPWIFADLGVYVGDVPVIGRPYLSRELVPHGAPFPAVHLGHHHGMDSMLLALTALALSRTLPDLSPSPVREVLSLYLAGLLVYGVMRAAEDGWNEQIVKRGWTRFRLPRVVSRGRPVGRRVWAGMGIGAVVVHRVWFGRDRTVSRRPEPTARARHAVPLQRKADKVWQSALGGASGAGC